MMQIAPLTGDTPHLKTSVLAASLPASEAFVRLLGQALVQVRATLDAAISGDVEGIHDLRVGVRRTRAVLALFKPVLRTPAARRFDEHLQQAGRVFGAARDWDVFVTETLPLAAKNGLAAAAIDDLTDAALLPRAEARAGLQRELNEGEFRSLLAALTAWAEDGRTSPELLGGDQIVMPIAELGPELLKRLRRRMAKRAKRLRHAPTPELHRLRKAVKVFRYATEGIGPIYSQKCVKAAIEASKTLQDLLGAVNDAAAITALTKGAGMDASPDLVPALTALRQWVEGHGAGARRRVPKAWDALRDAVPFW